MASHMRPHLVYLLNAPEQGLRLFVRQCRHEVQLVFKVIPTEQLTRVRHIGLVHIVPKRGGQRAVGSGQWAVDSGQSVVSTYLKRSCRSQFSPNNSIFSTSLKPLCSTELRAISHMSGIESPKHARATGSWWVVRYEVGGVGGGGR